MRVDPFKEVKGAGWPESTEKCKTLNVKCKCADLPFTFHVLHFAFCGFEYRNKHVES